MADNQNREQLLQFLDRKAFDPVLQAEPGKFPREKQDKFNDVRRSTESEKNRFHHDYGSASQIKDEYLDDLSSETGKEKTSELHALGLPALIDVKDEFMQLCERIGV